LVFQSTGLVLMPRVVGVICVRVCATRLPAVRRLV
jgi:hypothetical protein